MSDNKEAARGESEDQPVPEDLDLAWAREITDALGQLADDQEFTDNVLRARLAGNPAAPLLEYVRDGNKFQVNLADPKENPLTTDDQGQFVLESPSLVYIPFQSRLGPNGKHIFFASATIYNSDNIYSYDKTKDVHYGDPLEAHLQKLYN